MNTGPKSVVMINRDASAFQIEAEHEVERILIRKYLVSNINVFAALY